MEYIVSHKKVPCSGALVALPDYKGFYQQETKAGGWVELCAVVLNEAVFS